MGATTLTCPRCHGATERHETPRPDGARAWVERCESELPCGVWYDAASLGALHARFAEADVVEALYAAHAVEVAPALRIACPRCDDATPLAPVTFAGITLDLCRRCRGLWVDRDEYAALMHAMLLYDPTVEHVATAVYRGAPAQRTMARSQDWTRCVRCHAEVPFADALFTERGLVCVPCGLALQTEERDAATAVAAGPLARWAASIDLAIGRLLRGGARGR